MEYSAGIMLENHEHDSHGVFRILWHKHSVKPQNMQSEEPESAQ